ncbi:acyltransferase domain-containing protein [Streptomyces sp. BHT-5-2]|nr:acyltransferase domain-containing protein [Streptomyces sp. BHT-5-2]
MTEVPKGRWDVGAIYDPEPGVPGMTPSRWGAFLDDVSGFEPEFFGLSDREAELIDPQYRLLLEVACEAFEHAGYRPHGMHGSRTAVVVGCAYEDYANMVDFDRAMRHPSAAHGVVGVSRFTASGRIAYLLDLRGPAITLDTACSSSLVAVHLAAQALRSGEVDYALAGGVMLSLEAKNTVIFSTLGVLSPHGRCRAFSDGASGFVRGEGAGMVLLKRLDDAVRDGDRVLAVLQGTATNHNGRSSDTMLSPSAEAQRDVQLQVLQAAGVDPAQVALIETHGPGTPVGDPIEYAALCASYGTGGVPCALGSVKTNFGHCETAAGVAGLIKSILAVHHGRIPANLHFSGWNPEIGGGSGRFFVPVTALDWPAVEGPRVAAVSSYGMSGTNAHALVMQAPQREVGSSTEPSSAALFPVSAGSAQALAATAERIADWLETDRTFLRDVGHTLARCREHRSARATVRAATRGQLVDGLRGLAAGRTNESVSSGTARHQRLGPVWVFSGQGSQWAGMGRAMLASEPAFAAVVDELEPVIQAESGFSVRAVLLADEVVTGFARVQPALFAMQVALAAAWRSHGVEPGAIIGQSMGEVAAAVVAGGLSLTDGAVVICRRSRLTKRLRGKGTMAQVMLPAPRVAEELRGLSVDIAVVPSPSATVISGDVDQIQALVARWQQRDLTAGLIAVDVASHSPQVDMILDPLRAELAGLAPRAPEVAFYSTVLDDPRGTSCFDADYWADNLRQPVRLAEAVAAVLADGYRTFIEVSPHPLLTSLMTENAAHAGREVAVLPTLTRSHDESAGLLDRVAQAYCAGVHMSWPQHRQGQLAEVPLPVWARRPLWLPAELQRQDTAEPQAGRPLLGTHMDVPGEAEERHLWQTDAGTEAYPWLADHRVYGAPAMPAAGYIEIALAAGADLYGEHAPCELRDVAFRGLLTLDARTVITTQAVPAGDRAARLEIRAKGKEGLTATAILTSTPTTAPEPLDLDALLTGQQPAISSDPVFANARSKVVEHGPGFVGLIETYPPATEASRVLGRIELPRVLRSEAGRYRLHPVVLDAALQTLCSHPDVLATSRTQLPLGVQRMQVHNTSCTVAWCLAEVHQADDTSARADLTLLADDGVVVAEMHGVRLGSLAEDTADGYDRQRLLACEWDPAPPPGAARQATGAWLILDEDDAQGASQDPVPQGLAAALRRSGACVETATVPLPSGVMTAADRFLSVGDCQGVVMLCPPPGRTEDAGGLERARQRARRLVDLVRAMDSAGSARLYVVTRSTQPVPNTTSMTLEQAPLRGLCRVVGGELPHLRCTHLDLPADSNGVEALARELLADSPEDEVAWRDGVRYVARLRPRPFQDSERRPTTVRHGHDGYRLVPRNRGDLDSLELCTWPRRTPGADEVEIRVHAASLHFNDVLNALGRLPGQDGDLPLGLDCSGQVVAAGANVTHLVVGDRVAAFAPGSLASFVTVSAGTVFKLPDGMSYTEAATIPAVHLTAWYALHHVARVRSGEHVLIHSAIGGVGTAAVNLARATGAIIHATAGTPGKRRQLHALGISSVHDSRSLAFADSLRSGIDIVLNSLTGPALTASLGLLRPGGRFVELGKRDIHANHRLGLAPFQHNITFASVDLTLIADQLPQLAAQLTREVGSALAHGDIGPIPHTVYPLKNTATALRTMASADHHGKIIIDVPDHGAAPAVLPPGQIPLVRPDGAYIITGGLGGLGLLLAEDLTRHGPVRIVLNARSAPGPQALAAIKRLRTAGADIAVELGDIADPATADRLIAAATGTGRSLRGIAHAAARVIDATVTAISDDLLTEVWQAKAVGAWHLSAASEDHPLDWWLAFSSAASTAGNPGQGAYAAANGWLDALTTHRKLRGLPAHSIQWGAWADHGRGAALAGQGFTMIRPTEGLAACRAILRHDRPHTAYLPIQDARQFIGERLHHIPFFTALRPATGTPPTNRRANAAHRPLHRRPTRPARSAHRVPHRTHRSRTAPQHHRHRPGYTPDRPGPGLPHGGGTARPPQPGHRPADPHQSHLATPHDHGPRRPPHTPPGRPHMTGGRDSGNPASRSPGQRDRTEPSRAATATEKAAPADHTPLTAALPQSRPGDDPAGTLRPAHDRETLLATPPAPAQPRRTEQPWSDVRWHATADFATSKHSTQSKTAPRSSPWSPATSSLGTTTSPSRSRE